jgi:hypothetical protein
MAKTGIPISLRFSQVGRRSGGKGEALFGGGRQSISSLDMNSRRRNGGRSSRFSFGHLSRVWGLRTRNFCSWGVGAIFWLTCWRGRIGRCTPAAFARLDLCRVWVWGACHLNQCQLDLEIFIYSPRMAYGLT